VDKEFIPSVGEYEPGLKESRERAKKERTEAKKKAPRLTPTQGGGVGRGYHRGPLSHEGPKGAIPVKRFYCGAQARRSQKDSKDSAGLGNRGLTNPHPVPANKRREKSSPFFTLKGTAKLRQSERGGEQSRKGRRPRINRKRDNKSVVLGEPAL